MVPLNLRPERATALLLIFVAVTGCEDASAPVAIRIQPEDTTMLFGHEKRFRALLEAPEDGVAVEWSSSNPTIASVDDAGLVRGESPGLATIRAIALGTTGSTTIHISPLRFATLDPGSSSCGVTVEGFGYCWGDNRWWQLGDGTSQPRVMPTAIAGGHRFRAMQAGGVFSCGLTVDSLAYCWGRAVLPQPDSVPVGVGGRRFVALAPGPTRTRSG